MSDSGRQAFQRDYERWICLDCETKWHGMNPPQVCPKCGDRNTAMEAPDVDLDGRTIHHAPPLRRETLDEATLQAAIAECRKVEQFWIDRRIVFAPTAAHECAIAIENLRQSAGSASQVFKE